MAAAINVISEIIWNIGNNENKRKPMWKAKNINNENRKKKKLKTKK